MKHYDYTYTVTVDEQPDGSCTACVDNPDGPLRAYGPNPIAALRELVKVLADWQEGGAKRWLSTPPGIKLARQFVPGYEPGRGEAQA